LPGTEILEESGLYWIFYLELETLLEDFKLSIKSEFLTIIIGSISAKIRPLKS
jgi:hypothetical protein